MVLSGLKTHLVKLSKALVNVSKESLVSALLSLVKLR